MDDSKNATAQRANEFEEKNLVSEKDVTEQSKSTGNRNETRPPQSKELLDSALDFLSNASNEALFGVFACLMVATYIILGRLGLILIGTIAGVILHASWEGSSNGPHGHETGSTNARRRDFSLRIANRVLDWQTRKLSTDPDTKSAGELTLDLDYTTFRPKTAAALKSLTDAVIKDYVK